MKQINIFKYVTGAALIAIFSSCNDFLDQEPQATISPDKYLVEESQLAS